MKHHSILSVETFTLEGTLFAPDILDRLFKGELDSDYPFSVPPGMGIADEYGRAFRIAVAAWKQYQIRREKNPQAAERKFLAALFHDALGYDLPEKPDGFVPFRLAGDGTVPIFYSWYEDKFDETAHRFSGDGLARRKRSVTQYAQEWLNARDDHLWAIVTNARLIRLLRDNNSLTRPSYVEFDLERILSEERYPDFVFLWRLLYHDRVGDSPNGDHSVWERLRARGENEGVRVFNDLRDGVIRALQILGNAFLKNTRNEKLRGAFDAGTMTDQAYFQDLLLVAYRFLFLYVAEERKSLLFPAPDSPADAAETYEAGYSLHRLIRRAFRASAYDRHIDLYESVKIVFAALDHGEKELALPALGGLFRKDRLKGLGDCVLDNRALLEATRALRWTQMNGAYQLVDYRNLGAEELGSVYESLLELVPTVSRQERTFGFVGITEEGLTAGNARKTSGSYYTPSCLVDEQVVRVVDPLVRERLSSAVDKEKAILSISILDPACGSGHFLLAAARRLAERLAEIRAGDEAVTTTHYREALRDVVSNCIYGTDLNPMALELAKIALWIETLVPGQPLGFLDSHFVCGNSILGIDNLELLKGGIPAAAYKPLPGDSKDVAKLLAAKNRAELKRLERERKKGVVALPSGSANLAAAFASLETLPDSTLAEIAAKDAAYTQCRAAAETSRLMQAADLFTAAFLMPKRGETIPTTGNLIALLADDIAYPPPTPEMLAAAHKVCREADVLHWPLAFPAIFAKGGFDVILTNPPWDRVKLQEKEFFATRDPEIAQATNAAMRKGLIDALPQSNPSLYSAFLAAKRMAEISSVFIHDSGRFTLSNEGDSNLYSVFTEVVMHIRNPEGRAGLVVPAGICSDNSTQRLFAAMVNGKMLEAVLSFENEEFLFPAVHHSYKFSLLTLGQAETTDFTFFNRRVSTLADERRHFTLSAEEFALINPNTLTAPVFRSKADAELAKKIYKRVGVLWNETIPNGNPWGISFRTLFHMANDSALFLTSRGEDSLPLYEAKMIHQFDHRWASAILDNTVAELATLDEKRNPAFEVRPRYWVNCADVEAQFDSEPPKYLMGWRDITNAATFRSVIASVVPLSGVGHTMSLFFTKQSDGVNACLLGDMNSLVHDWCARQKIGGLHLSYNYVNQIPTLAPSAYSQADIDFIVPRVLELTYTSHSLKGWAEALGYEGEPFVFDPERRAILRAELDARYAKLYGLNEQELRYILDPADVYGEDYPSESFRVLKEKELAEFGEYRTQRMVLDAWHTQETPTVVCDDYKRTQGWADSRPSYLRFLVGQMIAQSSTHQIPLIDLFSAFSALRTPKEMARMDGMPKGVAKWAREYTDAIRDDESLEWVLRWMFEVGEISISRSGIVSYVDEGSLHAADDLLDVVMDARMALAFMRLDRTQARVEHIRMVVGPEFFRQVRAGFYARAA